MATNTKVCPPPSTNAELLLPKRSTVGHRRATTTITVPTCPCRCHWLLLLTIISGTLMSIISGSISGISVRSRRQLPASSSGTVNSVGNQTSMSASNALWKAPDGTVGGNGSSIGTAGGPGPSSVLAGSNAKVGGQSANGETGALSLGGTRSESFGSSSSMLNSNQTASQSGTSSSNAVGTGDVFVYSVGNGNLTNSAQSAVPKVAAAGMGGATGNQLAASNTSSTYQMSWNSIFARVSGVSISKGENNSQANINLVAGTSSTNMTVDGLVSGVNDKPGGASFSLASGDGTLMNNSAAMSSALLGAVNTTSGGTKMVGASNLGSSGTQNKGAINTFGNLQMNGTGPSNGGFLSNSSFGPDGSSRAGVAVSGTQMGSNKSITVGDGINSNDRQGSSASNGYGKLEGTGNLAANGSSFVLSGYQTDRGAAQIVETVGKSMATNNTAAELRIKNQGTEVINGTMGTNTTSNSFGKVLGQSGSVEGNSMLNSSRPGGQNANANTVAQGGGAGPSSAMTDTGLLLNGPNNSVKTTNIRGNVNATGDQTYVQSVSSVSDQNRQQALFNSQNATVKSAGEGKATASNSAILKRRRRHSRNLATLSVAEAKNWWQNVATSAQWEGKNLYEQKRRRRSDGQTLAKRMAQKTNLVARRENGKKAGKMNDV
ncbi:hypothetical protein niasHT_039018 [Heterodera trifolii]|uniref:Uncharacterized protein n=1 Tax=Heterodera trifolii TaxID=157864 RepID=A0ABD2J166_9BILA